MLQCFEKWANDASLFLTGEESLFPELINKDHLFTSLITPNVEFDEMAKQCLELISGAFVVVSKRMLHDHLSDGKLSTPSESLIQVAKSVPTTNSDAERDFGMLDRLMKIKPKALDIVYEGIIMFNRNKTREWRNNLSTEQLAYVMAKARLSKTVQKKQFFDRKKIIHEKRAAKFKNAVEEKERKAKDAATKERLVGQISEFGGLWDELSVHKNLKVMKSEKEKRLALKIQLNFRNKVLGVKCDKSLFFMSSGGKIKSVDELALNLCKVINWTADNIGDTVDTSVSILLPANVFNEQKSKKLKQAEKVITQKTQKKRKQPCKGNTKKKTAKKVISSSEVMTPIISSPDDLIGKLIEHLTDRNNENENTDWYKGLVVKQSVG